MTDQVKQKYKVIQANSLSGQKLEQSLNQAVIDGYTPTLFSAAYEPSQRGVQLFVICELTEKASK